GVNVVLDKRFHWIEMLYNKERKNYVVSMREVRPGAGKEVLCIVLDQCDRILIEVVDVRGSCP
ncbi:hypothetical protein HAX54_008209, partial [Datura stramonium]|nr:hypothetical protein [Datura stramonium]